MIENTSSEQSIETTAFKASVDPQGPRLVMTKPIRGLPMAEFAYWDRNSKDAKITTLDLYELFNALGRAYDAHGGDNYSDTYAKMQQELKTLNEVSSNEFLTVGYYRYLQAPLVMQMPRKTLLEAGIAVYEAIPVRLETHSLKTLLDNRADGPEPVITVVRTRDEKGDVKVTLVYRSLTHINGEVEDSEDTLNPTDYLNSTVRADKNHPIRHADGLVEFTYRGLVTDSDGVESSRPVKIQMKMDRATYNALNKAAQEAENIS